MRDDLLFLQHKMELDVTKNYHTSKKNVYGVENELHLIEQVQKCLAVMINKDDLVVGKLTLFNLQSIEERKGSESSTSNIVTEN